MTNFVRNRATAATLTMALMGLIAGGVASASPPPQAGRVAAAQGLSAFERTVAKVAAKLQSEVTALESRLAGDYLPTTVVNSTFLRTSDANATFLKTSDANATFLKTGDANTTFLKKSDASAEFLPVTGTAANASKLGGLPADQYLQGTGELFTNEVITTPTASPATLLFDGMVRVKVDLSQSSVPEITVENDTNQTLNVGDSGGTSHLINPQSASPPIPISAFQDTLQVFDPLTPSRVWTITVTVLRLLNDTLAFAGHMISAPA
jgi:hypothetical protein